MAKDNPYLRRYLGGEHEQVWEELASLGAAVHDEPLYSQALAVAGETMRRARHNFETLIPRLRDLGYVFGYTWAIERGTLSPDEAKVMQHHMPLTSPPSADARRTIDKVERRSGMLPLSLRAFFEIVGGTNFVGSHPLWGDYGLDAMLVESAEQIIELDNWGHWSGDKDESGAVGMPISPDERQKYFVSGNIYTIECPCAAADAILDGKRHHTTFVDYLRICFRWGGFPGWARLDHRPEQDIAFLIVGLLPL
jgi:hypothetical protein